MSDQRTWNLEDDEGFVAVRGRRMAKAMSFHEQALMLLRRQVLAAEDKVRLWEGEAARLRIELAKEEARALPTIPESESKALTASESGEKPHE